MNCSYCRHSIEHINSFASLLDSIDDASDVTEQPVCNLCANILYSIIPIAGTASNRDYDNMRWMAGQLGLDASKVDELERLEDA